MRNNSIINRAAFERLFGDIVKTSRAGNFKRICKDIVGKFPGDRAVAIWVMASDDGFYEMSIDTGYTVDRRGALRFSQGEGALNLEIRFADDAAAAGIIEVATRRGVPVPAEGMSRYLSNMAQALTMVLGDQLPPVRLVPPPGVPYSPALVLDIVPEALQAAAHRRRDDPMPAHHMMPQPTTYELAQMWAELRAIMEP